MLLLVVAGSTALLSMPNDPLVTHSLAVGVGVVSTPLVGKLSEGLLLETIFLNFHLTSLSTNTIRIEGSYLYKCKYYYYFVYLIN